MNTCKEEGHQTGSCSTCTYCAVLPAIFSKPGKDPFFVAPECSRGLLMEDSDGFDGKGNNKCATWKLLSQE